MPTTPESGCDTDTLSGNEALLDLICADHDLLQAEFDAIIAAAWGSPPGDPGCADPPRLARRARRHRDARGAAPRAHPHHPGVGGRPRQHSPPPEPPARTNPKQDEGR
jgi:hypothetical protein